ncbi:MAG: hypothetical protein ABUT20_13520 [Bacteroidota bacterium]
MRTILVLAVTAKNSRMFRKIFFLISFSLTILSCSDWRDKWHNIHLIHDIYLEWVRYPEEQYISLGSWNCGVGGNVAETEPGIFAVGYDSSFIIAKQHPHVTALVDKRKLNKSTTNYYIINIKNYPTLILDRNDISIFETEKSFVAARDSLGVSQTLAFTIISKDFE